METRKIISSFIFLFTLISLVNSTSHASTESPLWDSSLRDKHSSKPTVTHQQRLIVKFKSKLNASLRQQASNHLNLNIHRDFNALGISVLSINNNGNKNGIKQAIDALQKSGNVEYAVQDYLLHVDTIPNDPRFHELWGLNNTGQTGGTFDKDIDAPEAWNQLTGDPSIVIAVIDTGVDYNHEDLSSNIWVNPGEIPGNGIDDDKNGYVDDIHGIDAVNNDSDPIDDHGHGTHVSGTIAAVSNNGIGITGVSWNSRIMGLKFLDASGRGYTSDAIECLNYIIMMKQNFGINILLSNNSWGGGAYSQPLRDAIAAQDATDILFVASAGNSGRNIDSSPSYPASYDVANIISVASTDHNDQLSYFSNYGLQGVDLAAPGSNILSTTPGNNYKLYSGTSMASPHVSGAVALLKTFVPSASAAELKALLLDTVDPVAALSTKVYSQGRLNINNALSCIPGSPSLNIISPASVDFRSVQDETTLLSASITDCGQNLTTATVTVNHSASSPNLALLDDGTAPDEIANDGLYSASWLAEDTGSVTLTFSATGDFGSLTDSITGTVVEITSYSTNNQIPFEWIDATSGTNAQINYDDSSVEIPIGFDFAFYGASYQNIRISSNGYLTFGQEGNEHFNRPIPTMGYVDDFIAAYWDDLNPEVSGQIFYLLEGEAPHRRLTIEWHEMSRYDISNLGKITFEAMLYEGTNNIRFQYLDASFDGTNYDNGADATVGLEMFGGNKGLQYSFNNLQITDGLAIEFSSQATANPVLLDIKSNTNNLMVGENLISTLTIHHQGTTTISRDLWLVIQLPDGQFVFYPDMTDTPAITLNCFDISPGPFLTNFEIANYTFSPGEEGVYHWFTVLSPCGADLNSGIYDLEQITVNGL